LIVLLGIASGVLLIAAVNTYISRQRKSDRLAKYNDVKGVVEVQLASIAKDAGPLISQQVTKGTILSIVGDGYYADSPKSSIWLEYLEAWLKAGAIINYILINPNRSSFDALENVLSEKHITLNLYVVVSGLGTKRFDDIATLFHTLHPTLIENQNGNGMWLEYNHPRNTCHSYGNIFVPPVAMTGENEILFQSYKKYISEIIAEVPKNSFPTVAKAA
jgi:hypothetical protein